MRFGGQSKYIRRCQTRYLVCCASASVRQAWNVLVEVGRFGFRVTEGVWGWDRHRELPLPLMLGMLAVSVGKSRS